MAEIKSFEEAEKTIEKLRLVSGSSQNLMYNTGLQQALEILRELEASVGKQLSEIEKLYQVEPLHYHSYDWVNSGKMAILRRLLEGEKK